MEKRWETFEVGGATTEQLFNQLTPNHQYTFILFSKLSVAMETKHSEAIVIVIIMIIITACTYMTLTLI